MANTVPPIFVRHPAPGSDLGAALGQLFMVRSGRLPGIEHLLDKLRRVR